MPTPAIEVHTGPADIEIRPGRSRAATRIRAAAFWGALIGTIAAIGYAGSVAGRHVAALDRLSRAGLRLDWVDDDSHIGGGYVVKSRSIYDKGAITDEVASYLPWVVRLRGLDLGRVDGLTDEGLATIGGLSGLRELALTRGVPAWPQGVNRKSGPVIRDASLEHLRGLRELVFLSLDGAEVTDPGLDALSSLPKLEILSVANTRVTDAGLGRLRALKGLKQVQAEGSKVTCEGRLNFMNERPEVTIILPECDAATPPPASTP